MTSPFLRAACIFAFALLAACASTPDLPSFLSDDPNFGEEVAEIAKDWRKGEDRIEDGEDRIKDGRKDLKRAEKDRDRARQSVRKHDKAVKDIDDRLREAGQLATASDPDASLANDPVIVALRKDRDDVIEEREDARRKVEKADRKMADARDKIARGERDIERGRREQRDAERAYRALNV